MKDMKENDDQVMHRYLPALLAAIIIGGSILIGANNISNSVPKSLEDFINKIAINTKVTGPTAPEPTQPSAPAKPTVADMSGVTIPDAMIRGNKNAAVTVIEFSDFQCPFCKRLYDQVENQLRKEYVDTGKVRFVYKNYAFLGPDSTTAAEGSYCAAEQDKFWEYHDYMFTNQGAENGGWVSADNVKTIAKNLGLNTNKFNTCLDSGKYKETVSKDLAEGQKVGVNGTPATFIDGEEVAGAQPYATFKEVIERKLKGA